MKAIDFKSSEGRQRFYQSNAWRALRSVKLARNPFCERCVGLVIAVDVHHIIDIQNDTTKCLRFDNLESLCKSCHSIHTSNKMVIDGSYKRDYKTVNLKWKDIKDKLK